MPDRLRLTFREASHIPPELTQTGENWGPPAADLDEMTAQQIKNRPSDP
jgi:hypothetical protein